MPKSNDIFVDFYGFYLFGLLFVYFSFWFCACVCFLLFVICFGFFLKRETKNVELDG